MMRNFRGLSTVISFTLLVGSVAVFPGCSANTAKGAAQGATGGAVAGALGGMVSALVFGGDVAEAGARGAVWGGTTGAVAGGISGAQADKAIAAQEQARRDAEMARIRQEVGDDAFNGIIALAECKHDVAIANANVAANSRNKDYALAGVWVAALSEADRQHDAEARALYPTIVAHDREVKDEAEAEALLREALQELGDIRVEYKLPAVCPK